MGGHSRSTAIITVFGAVLAAAIGGYFTAAPRYPGSSCNGGANGSGGGKQFSAFIMCHTSIGEDSILVAGFYHVRPLSLPGASRAG